MVNINLVPEVKKEQAKIKKTNLSVTTLAFLVGGSLLAAVLILGSLLAYRSARISTVDKNIAKIEDELKVYKELEESVMTLEIGLAEIKGIVGGGRDWTALYGDLEKATPADIRFISFKINGNSILADLEGSDVKSIDRFIKSFSGYKNENDINMYENIIVDGYTAGDGGKVTFHAKFDVVGESK